MSHGEINMQYFVIDAFTSQAFAGNPAAVVILKEAVDDKILQAIAAEFNLAETAFLLHDKNNYWSLRWFTPLIEIDLCGHATLASAFVIWNKLSADKTDLIFKTQSGELAASHRGDLIELNFPRIHVDSTGLTGETLSKLNITPRSVARTEHDLILELKSEEEVQQYQPDFQVIESLPTRGLIITATGEQIDFASRFFAPKIGIPEDPVTGAIHCALAPFWAQKKNKTQFKAKQLSKRGGDLDVELVNDRVLLRGSAVCTMEGELVQ